MGWREQELVSVRGGIPLKASPLERGSTVPLQREHLNVINVLVLVTDGPTVHLTGPNSGLEIRLHAHD